jgi:CheY-like chemotaxis protein
VLALPICFVRDRGLSVFDPSVLVGFGGVLIRFWEPMCTLNIPLRQVVVGGGNVSELPLILVIEDEYLLQADVEKVLTDAGFATDIVSSGEEALTLLMDGTKRPSALVTDVKLAGRLTGWEVAKRIREKDPSFPVIYVTAHERDWPAYGVPNSIVIPKPFAPAQLVTAVSNLLNARTPPTT